MLQRSWSSSKFPQARCQGVCLACMQLSRGAGRSAPALAPSCYCHSAYDHTRSLLVPAQEDAGQVSSQLTCPGRGLSILFCAFPPPVTILVSQAPEGAGGPALRQPPQRLRQAAVVAGAHAWHAAHGSPCAHVAHSAHPSTCANACGAVSDWVVVCPLGCPTAQVCSSPDLGGSACGAGTVPLYVRLSWGHV